MTKGTRLVDLFQELRRIDDHSVPDDVHRALSQDPGWQEMERVQLVAHLDRVPCVRAALEPHNDVRAVGKVVDDLPLAFVPKLGSDHNRRGHPNRRLNIASRLMVLGEPRDSLLLLRRCTRAGFESGMVARRPRAITFYSLEAFARYRLSGREGVPYCPRPQTRLRRMSSAWTIV